MQDVFVEHMVKRVKTPKHVVFTILLILGAIIVALAAILFSGFLGAFSMFGPLIAIGAIYGAYHLITSMSVEYEYLITNGEMDVDQITAQRKRKRLITFPARGVEEFGPYKPEEHAGKEYKTRIEAYDDIRSDDLWYAVTYDATKGRTLVIFNGPERVLRALKPFLPRQISHEVLRDIR